MISFLYKVYGHDQHTDDRGGRGRKSGSGHSHSQRINKYIIQNDICKAADDHSCHGKTRSTVVPHKAEQQIVPQKQRGKYQQDADVVGGISDRISVGSENRGDPVRKEDSARGEDHGSEGGEIQGLGKDCAVQRPFRLCRRDCIPRGSAHAYHKSSTIHQAVCRQHKIKRREGISSDSPGDEKCVGKDVAGIAYHAKHVCRYIFQKKIADSFFHDIYSVR